MSVHTVKNMYIQSMYNVCNVHALTLYWLCCQHAHIDNLKTIANLTNNKDVFMCIIRFHARVGYLQTYETLLKEINTHPGSDNVPGADDQYQVECLALADRNMNIPCESGIRYPSLTAMLNRRDMYWRITVQIQFNLACTMYVQCMYNVCTMYVI